MGFTLLSGIIWAYAYEIYPLRRDIFFPQLVVVTPIRD